jgi:hypothetical protein
MNKTDDQQTVVALKKALSSLSQAFEMAVNENGTPETWGLTDDDSGLTLQLDILKPFLNVSKDCSAGGITGCFPAGEIYYGLNKAPYLFVIDDAGHSLMLSDGTSIHTFMSIVPNCNDSWGPSLALQNICSAYLVDVNGYKKPNVLGKDTFIFWLTRYGIVPAGGDGDTGFNFSRCVDGSGEYGDSTSCAAWVIYNGNLDYLKCPDKLNAGWSGPHSCN